MKQQLHASKKKKSSCKEGQEACKEKSSKEASKEAKSSSKKIIIQTSYEYRMIYYGNPSPYYGAGDFLFIRTLTLPLLNSVYLVKQLDKYVV